ncbi:tetratricopeptide repeat protein [Neisseria sp. Ec49-e6-T10]|uniref:tetratricopeptide repeat protein n=1 Tax=Neisseria sp. Ec49-e6-T10 TaxID=3140744 RepID=UPI003EC02D85
MLDMQSPIVLVIVLLLVLVVVFIVFFLMKKTKKTADGSDEPSVFQQETLLIPQGSLQGATEVRSLSETDLATDADEVSLEKVDLLTEYEIYLQFGYLERATRTLASYLKDLKEPPSDLREKLLSLFLECHMIDDYSDELEKQYHEGVFNQEALAQHIITGLKIDRNNLTLRSLAEVELGWGPNDVLSQLGEQIKIIQTEKPVASSDSEQIDQETASQPKTSSINTQSLTNLTSSYLNGKASTWLVTGRAKFKGKLSIEEKEIIKTFISPKERAKLFVLDGDYVNAIAAYEKALKVDKHPLTLLVNILRLDYLTKNLDTYLAHFWAFCYEVGDQADIVKRQLLHMGLSLGQHDAFADLELATTKSELDQIAKRYGISLIKESTPKQHKQEIPLVKSGGLHNDVESQAIVQTESTGASSSSAILDEAEAQLGYGQIEEAMVTLENGLYENPHDVQLYPLLLDLYERLDDKARFNAFSQKMREKNLSLPEEANLAISHLAQRMNMF